MEASHAYVVHYDGCDVECYGTLEETSNFSVVCADEWDDDVWCDADPITGDAFRDWETVVFCLQPHFASRILEISAV
jgi:hypothetical protein